MRNYLTKHTNISRGSSHINLRKGLKQVHIGNDVWLCGRVKNNHMVIYGPNNKEYHVYNNDVKFICCFENEYYGYITPCVVNRHGNYAIHAKLKIYILTNILDNKENWCFDLSKIPNNGKLKVICENGTIKNIDFNGIFYPQELVSKRFRFTKNFVNIIGYRNNKNNE